MPLPTVEKRSQNKFPSKADRAKIAERAYFKWCEAGKPQGHDGREFWFTAEQELTKAEVTLEEVLEVEVVQ